MKKIILSLLTIIASFIDSKGQIYCIPSPISVDGITNVSIPTGINNTTIAEAENYGVYSVQIATLFQGTTVPINITYARGYAVNRVKCFMC